MFSLKLVPTHLRAHLISVLYLQLVCTLMPGHRRGREQQRDNPGLGPYIALDGRWKQGLVCARAKRHECGRKRSVIKRSRHLLYHRPPPSVADIALSGHTLSWSATCGLIAGASGCSFGPILVHDVLLRLSVDLQQFDTPSSSPLSFPARRSPP